MSHFPGQKTSRPRVLANFALTWDGRISTRSKTPSDFSSPADKARLLKVRAEGDAVLASAATVRADSMTMGLPAPLLREARMLRGQTEYPLRVIWCNSGAMPTTSKLLSATFSPIVILTTSRMSPLVREALAPHARVQIFPGENLPPGPALQWLAGEYGVQKIVFEGGGTLFRLFLEHRCIDELCLTHCPLIFGGRDGVTLTGAPREFLPTSVKARIIETEQIGQEWFTRWKLRYWSASEARE